MLLRIRISQLMSPYPVLIQLVAALTTATPLVAQFPSSCPNAFSAPKVPPPEPFPPLPSPPTGVKIYRLEVRIETSNDIMSGTENQVWFDIGPIGWQLPGDFPRGSDRTIDLPLEDHSTDPLYSDDIVQLRLEKKGMCGFTNAPDSPLDVMIPEVPITPQQTVEFFRGQVRLAQYAVGRAQVGFDEATKAAKAAADIIAEATKSLNEAQGQLLKLPDFVAEANNRLIDLKARVMLVPLELTHDVCHSERKWVFVVLGGWWEMITVCHLEKYVNPLYTQLTEQIEGITKRINAAQADMARFALQQQQAVTRLSQGRAAQEIADKAVGLAGTELVIAREALGVASVGLAEAAEVAKSLNLPGISLPKPNQWKPTRVTLIVNGEPFASAPVGVRLKKGNPVWVYQVRPLNASQQLAHGLRVRINKASSRSDEQIAILSTVGKESGVSGWFEGPVREAVAIGVLRHRPSAGSDGFVSLDLEVEKIEVPRSFLPDIAFVLDGQHGVRHRRFIRIEYAHRDRSGRDDTRYLRWSVGQRFRIRGPVEWDTDAYGFFELHPTAPKDLTELPALPPDGDRLRTAADTSTDLIDAPTVGRTMHDVGCDDRFALRPENYVYVTTGTTDLYRNSLAEAQPTRRVDQNTVVVFCNAATNASVQVYVASGPDAGEIAVVELNSLQKAP